MRRGHEVQIMAAFLLQIQHHICQAFWPDAVPQATLAQREVLAVGTACLAVAKEDRACSTCAADRRFLAPMHVPRCHNGLCTRATYAGFASNAVTAAVLRADCAATQDFPGSGSTFCQFACFIEIQVTWIEHERYQPSGVGHLKPRREGFGPVERGLAVFSLNFLL